MATTLSADIFVVTVVDISGVPHSVISTSRDEAISYFMSQAYLFAHAAPDQVFRVIGDDFDASLTGLHLIWDAGESGAVAVVSLTRPGSIGSNPGWVAPDHSEKPFTQIGDAIDLALRSNAGSLDASEVRRLQFSRAAMAMRRSLADEMLHTELESEDRPKVTEADAKRVWKEMAAVDQFVQMMAVVRG